MLPPKSQNESHELSPANIFFGTDRLQNEVRKINRPDEVEENEVFTEQICEAPIVQKPPRNFSYSNSTQVCEINLKKFDVEIESGNIN